MLLGHCGAQVAVQGSARAEGHVARTHALPTANPNKDSLTHTSTGTTGNFYQIILEQDRRTHECPVSKGGEKARLSTNRVEEEAQDESKRFPTWWNSRESHEDALPCGGEYNHTHESPLEAWEGPDGDTTR